MKKWLFILSMFLLPVISVFAQDDETDQDPPGGGKVQQRMQEYIQKRLDLSKDESQKLNPVFVRYFREFVKTHRENRTDKLILQQKIIELRLRYRTEFRQILGEDKGNKIFKYEDEFRQETLRIMKENRKQRMGRSRFRA